MTMPTQTPHEQPPLWELPEPKDPMRAHMQGAIILVALGFVLLALLAISNPILSDAFGENGAIVAESSEETDSSDEGEEIDPLAVPLNGEEVAQLQADLAALEFDPGPVDGILGDGTRGAIDQAIDAYQLDTESTDRQVFQYVSALVDGLDAADAAETLGGEDVDAEAQAEADAASEAEGDN